MYSRSLFFLVFVSQCLLSPLILFNFSSLFLPFVVSEICERAHSVPHSKKLRQPLAVARHGLHWYIDLCSSSSSSNPPFLSSSPPPPPPSFIVFPACFMMK